jgi:very-short-patch-repair endonuclease
VDDEATKLTGKVKRIVTGQRVKPEKLARAKELRRAMTPHERVLWERLRGNRLAGLHFRRQQIIDGLIVDFYCHQAGVALEVDGPVHSKQIQYDQARSDWLQARGLQVLRVTNAEIDADLEAVLARIRKSCAGPVTIEDNDD